jgi:hypothetical protein
MALNAAPRIAIPKAPPSCRIMRYAPDARPMDRAPRR